MDQADSGDVKRWNPLDLCLGFYTLVVSVQIFSAISFFAKAMN